MGCCDHKHTETEVCAACGFDPFVRNHFFTSKMMGAGDFSAETRFHSEKMRHHNVRLHGSGTVCGLEVKQHGSSDCVTKYVIVRPGSALDCCGHEILVVDDEYLEVARDPDVLALANDSLLHTLQVCVSWRECGTEEVPVLYDECGCDDDKCAPNRILEGFAFDVRVDPPLGPVETANGPALGAFVGSHLHGVTGFMRAANGRVAFIDPTDPQQLVLLDPAHREARRVTLPTKALAATLASDGAHVFVAIAPVAPATTCEVRVYSLTDGAEVPPIAAPRSIPGTDSSSVLSALAGTGSQTLLIYIASSGATQAWMPDNTAVIADGPAQSYALDAGLTSMVGDANGTTLYGILPPDPAGGRRARGYTLGATITKTDFSATAHASALATFDIGAAPAARLAIASALDKRVYLVNPTVNPATVTSVDLAHPPEFIGVVNTSNGTWLQIVEIDNAHVYQQAVNLTPLATGGTAQLTAARLAGEAPDYLIALFDAGLAGVVNPGVFAAGDCSDLLWRQVKGCPSCDTADCVVLATIANYRPGLEMLDPGATSPTQAPLVTRIDNRLGRHVLASTETLQDWIQCLELSGSKGPKGDTGPTGGVGPQGPAGPGLETGLTRINGLSWQHNGVHNRTNNKPTAPLTMLVDGVPASSGVFGNLLGKNPIDAYIVGFNGKVQWPLKGLPLTQFQKPWNLTTPIAGFLWFDLHVLVFPVTGVTQVGDRITAAKLDVSSTGPLPTTFPALALIVLNLNDNTYDPITYGLSLVRLRGEHILDDQGRAIDAEFARSQLPTGDRPAGNDYGIQGGTFESWFTVAVQDQTPGTSNDGPLTGTHYSVGHANLNSASAIELMAVPGIAPATALNIVKARATRRDGFKRIDDLRTVTGVDAATLAAIKSNLRID